MTKTTILYILNSGIVLDRTALASLNSAQTEETLATIRSAPRGASLRVVDNAQTFFTAGNLIAALKAGSDDARLIADHVRITLNAGDVSVIKRAEELQAEIIEKMKPVLPPYKFATTPVGWAIEDDLNIGKARVSRKRAFAGVGRGYPLSLLQARRIWDVASKVWNGDESAPRSVLGVRADGYSRNAYIQSSRVEVGCQNIQRYELEQLALNRGWPFPEAK
jgi:hypothetical protein